MTVSTEMIVIAFVIPFSVWLTVSMFNQKTEIALLKQCVDELKKLVTQIVGKF